jgi:hypothetical protein
MTCSCRGLVFRINVPHGRQGRIWCYGWSEHRASSFSLKYLARRVDFTLDVCADPDARLVSNVYFFQLTSSSELQPFIRRAVYTPTQIINFTLVPPQFRFVFVSLVSLVWSMSSVPLWKCRTDLLITDTYLSIVNAQLGRDITEPVGY